MAGVVNVTGTLRIAGLDQDAASRWVDIVDACQDHDSDYRIECADEVLEDEGYQVTDFTASAPQGFEHVTNHCDLGPSRLWGAGAVLVRVPPSHHVL